MTLNALATALEGRGDQIGENLETVDSYLKRLNPQIPALVEDLRLTAEVSDTYADVLPQIGDILHNTVTTTGTLETREAKLQRAAQRRHPVLRDRAQLPRRQRRQPDPARRGEPGPAPGAGALLDRVPVPARRHRERRQAAGRGVPRLHPAHRARDAAQPAASPTRPPTSRVSARTAARPACTCPTRRGASPTRSAASPTSTTASTRRSARAPSASAASYAPSARLGGFGGYAGSPEESDLLAALLAPGLGTTPRRRPRPRWPAARPDGPRRDRVLRERRGDPVKLLDKKTTGDLVKLLDLHRRHHAGHRRPGDRRSATSRFAGTTTYKAVFADATGVVKGDDIRIAGVKVGNVKDVEITDRTRALVTFSVEDDDPGHRGDPRHDQVPQPGRPALHRAHPGGRLDHQALRRRDDPDRPRPRRRSTSPCCSTASSRSSRRSARPTSTSSPTRSSRSSRARAARSRACSATPPRSPTRWPTATR